MSDLKKIFPKLPKVSDEQRLDMHRKYAAKYIFYRKHKNFVDGYCTHCMKKFQVRLDEEIITPADMERQSYGNIRNGDMCGCPRCGCIATARAEGIPRQKLTNYHELCVFLPTKDAVYAVCGELVAGYGWDKMTIEEMERDYGGSRFEPYWIIEYTEHGARQARFNWYYGWQDSISVSEPYIMRGGFYSEKHFYQAYNHQVLWNTFLRYHLPCEWALGNGRYDGAEPFRYLSYAVRYPAVEMLIKSGGMDIVEDIVRGRSCKRVINLEGKSAAEVFRVDGNEAALIRKAMQNNRVTITTLQCWWRLKVIARRHKWKLKPDDAVKLMELRTSYGELVDIVDKSALTPTKLVNYITKQAKKRKESVSETMSLYRDYINECKDLEYDLKDTQISKPSDLQAAHERTSAALNAIREEIAIKKEAKQYKEYQEAYEKLVKKYECGNDEYMIIVPKSAYAIVQEGKNLGHCVGGYADRHMRGVLTILFMRNPASPDTALYTIEMDGNRMVQIRGRSNCAPTPEAKVFVDKWLEWVKLPANKKHPKKKKESAA